MRLPTAILEQKKISRIIFSVQISPLTGEKISPLMKGIYERGGWCFDLPSLKHMEAFKKLKQLVEDKTLVGFCHLELECGVSFLGKPLGQFEPKVISTVFNNIVPPDVAKKIIPSRSSQEVFTQKEMDRISFDPIRFEKTINLFEPEESPFLLVGGKYGDWLLGLGRIDLLKEMIRRVRKKGFIPIFSGQWATFVLPKAKSLDVAACAIPINKKSSLFSLDQACHMIKKFEGPIISLNPLADGSLLKNSEDAFSFLFNELKITSAITEVSSEDEVQKIVASLKTIPSLTPFRKT
jgi:hypothetical protein